MSLLMDVLKRFQLRRRPSSVHPLLLKKKEKNRRKLLLPLMGILFILATGTAYLLTDFIASRIGPPAPPRKIQTASLKAPEPPRIPAEPVREEPPKPPPEPVKEEVPQKEIEQAKTAKVEPKEELRKVTEDIKEKPREIGTPEVKVKVLEDPVTYLLLADRYFREGNLPKSKEYYLKAYSLRKTPKTANNLIVVCIRMGDLPCAEGVLEENPREDLVYTYLLELSRSGLQREAIRSSQKYLHLDREGFVSFATGYAYETLGDYESALKNYKTAYTKNPYNPYFAYNYARLLDYTRNYREAFRIYSTLKGLKIDPSIKRSVEERLKILKLMGFGE
jgi:tetratricopeptide (TPR) repeat protein